MSDFRKIILRGNFVSGQNGSIYSPGVFKKLYLDIPADFLNIVYGYGNLYGVRYGSD